MSEILDLSNSVDGERTEELNEKNLVLEDKDIMIIMAQSLTECCTVCVCANNKVRYASPDSGSTLEKGYFQSILEETVCPRIAVAVMPVNTIQLSS